MRSAVELAGDLSDTPLPAVLWNLFACQVSGVLLVTRGKLSKQIYLADGQPSHAESNLLHETLTRFLVSEKAITEDQEKEAERRALEGEKPLTDVILEMEAMEPAALFEALRENFALKVLDCFSWESGSYQFESSAWNEADAVAALKMNPARLILKGIREYFPLSRIEVAGRFSSEKTFRVARHAKGRSSDAFQLTAEEIGFLARFRNAKRVDEVIRESDLPRECVVRLLYGFSVLELLESAESSEEVSLDELVGATLLQMLKPAEPPSSVLEADRETQDLANSIVQDHMRLMGLNYFELLELPETATAVSIRDQFIEFAMKYNPGRFRSGALGEFRNLGEELFLRGVKAYGALSDFDSKSKVLDKIKAERNKVQNTGKRPGESFKIQTTLLDARAQFAKGLRHLKDREYEKAVEYFEYAHDIEARNADFLSHLGWAMYEQHPEQNRKKAEEVLKKARDLELTAYSAYFLGKYLIAHGMRSEGLEHLQAAVDLDPKNIDMVRELRNAQRAKK